MLDLTPLDILLAVMPKSSILSVELKTQTVMRALIPDSTGKRPGTDGYVTTVDWAYAAWMLVGVVEAQSTVTSAGSESTTVSASPPNWDALRAYYVSISPLLQAQMGDHITPIFISRPHYTRRTRMEDYDDIDTDIG